MELKLPKNALTAFQGLRPDFAEFFFKNRFWSLIFDKFFTLFCPSGPTPEAPGKIRGVSAAFRPDKIG
ncbi:MAG TPA: hypothetical protein VL527_15125 [Dongiaceae bacterium]|nr:hypothetical protein [Dongiaceae bacterium]